MIGFFTSVCEEDAVWIPQYLAEIDRLNFDFTINFDKCSEQTKELIKRNRHCVGFTLNDDKDKKFSELDKQGVLDLLIEKGYDWALNVDIDETWEKNAPEKFKVLDTATFDVGDYKWVNLWGDKHHIRTDGPCASGHRSRIYNLHSPWEWRFYSEVINGASAWIKEKKEWRRRLECDLQKIDLTCLHWGLMTEEMRVSHKKRWDAIYGSYSNNVNEYGSRNPYGFWDWCLDPNITPRIEEHDYL